MQFRSTNTKNHFISFKDAVLQSMPSDQGLYLPESFPQLSKDIIKSMESMSFIEQAQLVAKSLIGNNIEKKIIDEIVNDSFDFYVPLINLDDHLSVLELFHGPTLSFKDFGARFMARVMRYFTKGNSLNVLVATSGDTGSAVANGFLGIDGINVFVLYPSGTVSNIQEKQFTTLGNNIIPIEVKGNFDDCQRIVKSAFNDTDINSQLHLTSANSINIARLIPQTFYYFHAYFKAMNQTKDIVFSTPCGNFGNITAGLIAKKMGLPIHMFLAATNKNDIVPQYFLTGNYNPKDSVSTISNAMDVGDPSNMKRIFDIYDDLNDMKQDILSWSFSDKATYAAMIEINKSFNYIMDPHGSVAYLAAMKFLKQNKKNNTKVIILETAHPAKFMDVLDSSINQKVVIPNRLQTCIDKKKQSILMDKDYNIFKEFLVEYIRKT